MSTAKLVENLIIIFAHFGQH